MNTVHKASGHVNHINRDLAIVFAIGFVVALAVVTMGIMVMGQF